MVLDNEIRSQLTPYLELLENDIELQLSAEADAISLQMRDFVDELAAMSPKISVTRATLPRTPSFRILRSGVAESGITFAGIPLGHEFSSLVLALLQVSGRPPKVQPQLIERIKRIPGIHQFESYISLSCHNCPEIVQALNLLSVLNPNITHTMVDGAAFQSEVDSKSILAVPTIHHNGEYWNSGRMTLEEILAQLAPPDQQDALIEKDPFDVLVVGGGPAGASAAIYAARKGIRTGLIAERFGGQVKDTLGIENYIGLKYTEGPKLAAGLEEHIGEYDVDLIKAQRTKRLSSQRVNGFIELELENGSVLKSKSVILATGARWRTIGVPGELEFKNKGVAYCPHCDGPVFKGKRVAVIGGGNSGVEAAIDLAGLAAHVTVLEFLPELKADRVLQERLRSLPNVSIVTNAQTDEITGTTRVNGLRYTDRNSGEKRQLDLEGVFVLIGLAPNTDWLSDAVERNRHGEVVVDSRGATSVPGIFAAGDCTDSPYKQIVISLGSGATAALGAFDYLIRN